MNTLSIAIDAAPLISCLGSAVEAFDRTLEIGNRPVDLVERIEVLLVEPNGLFAIRTVDGAVFLDPSQGLLDLVAALRAGQINLGITEQGHNEVSIGCLATPMMTKAGESDNSGFPAALAGHAA